MNFSRTLIIKPSSMGDIVQALPVLTALKESHPEARVSWLVAQPFADLLESHPRLEEIIVFDRERYARIGRSVSTTLEFARFLKGLRQKRFTTVLDLQGLFRSGLVALATGAPNRVGFRSARELAPLFYTAEVVTPRIEIHAVDRYVGLARHVGLSLPKATDHLPVSAERRAAIRRRLATAGLAADEPFLVVCADARWPSKQWPAARFAQVLDRMRETAGAPSVLVGGPSAVPIAQTIAATMTRPPIDLTGGTTLKELVAVIAEAHAMVANDSGPMHVAAAVGTPVVAIFGPTNPRRTGPYGPGHYAFAGRAPCSPCYRRQCLYASGSLALCCLKNITTEEVVEHLLEIWRRGEKTMPAGP